jgi:AraC-like DNA-binding protein
MVLAHHMLTDQRWTGVGIAPIAYDAGFGDLSYFNRTFKRCYGTTPSKYATRLNRRTNFAMAALPTLDGLRVGLWHFASFVAPHHFGRYRTRSGHRIGLALTRVGGK